MLFEAATSTAPVKMPCLGADDRASDNAIPHVLNIGDYVVILATGCSGPFIEGFGIIESYDSTPDWYQIQFTGERRAKRRFINPDWQAAPERSLALLREFWRSCRRDEPVVEDFFPEETCSTEEGAP